MKKTAKRKIVALTDLNLFSLSFKSDFAKYENGFIKYFLTNSFDLAILTIILSVFLYSVFGLLDYILFPQNYITFWFIRLIVSSMLIILAILMKSGIISLKFHQNLLFFIMLISGMGITLMMVCGSTNYIYYYFSGLMLVIFTGFTFIRLRFSLAFISSLIIIIAMEYITIVIADFPREIIILENFFVISSFLLSAFVGFSLEFYRRREFLMHKKMEEQQQIIFKLNENLEQDVSLRTEQLISANMKLKEEMKERIKLEKAEENHKKNIIMLAKSAMNFVKPNIDKFIFKYIGETLHEFSKKNIVVLSQINEENGTFQTQLVFGFEQIQDKVLNKIDFDFFNNPVKYDEETLIPLKTGKLTELKIGFCEYFEDRIPNEVCSSIEKSMNFGKIYTIGFNWNNKVFGTADIITLEDNPIDNIDLIETYVAQASVAIQRHLVERDLANSEKWYRTILEKQGEGVAIVNSQEEITFCNPVAEEIFGVQPNTLCGRSLRDFLNDEEFDKLIEESKDKMLGESFKYELTLTRTDVTEKQILITATPIYSKGKVGTLGIFRDITQRKNDEKKLQKSLEEKQVLLKEVHHRVKNNMQIISSLIRMQSRASKNPDIVDSLITSQNRVQSMAIIHEKLYQSPDFTSVNFKNYIEQLVGQLAITFDIEISRIKIIHDIDRIDLNINLAVPCGLIVNEIISNSIKYAFPDDRRGSIKTSFKKLNDQFQLIISDNGVGLPKNFDPDKCTSLGLQIIKTLTTQLHGKMETINDNGLTYKLTFDNPNLKSYN